MLDLLPCLEYELIMEQNPVIEDGLRTPSGYKTLSEEEVLGNDARDNERDEEHRMTNEQLREVRSYMYMYTCT